jgi:hypothetical protein
MGGAGFPAGEAVVDAELPEGVASVSVALGSAGVESAGDSVVVRTTTRIPVRRRARRVNPGDVTVL